MGLYAGFTKKNPLRYYRGLPRMWITAFGTSSSAATLSTTIKCCENLGVSKDSINCAMTADRTRDLHRARALLALG